MSITPFVIGILSIIAPGFFLALALLKKTGMSIVEIALIGIIFGMLFPPAMIWAEAYLIPYAHAFSFSAALYNVNVIILTIIGIVLSIWQGAIDSKMFKGLFSQKSSTEAEAEMSADYRSRLKDLRGTASRLSSDLKIVKMHEKEEEELVKRQAEEISMLRSRGAGPEELTRIEESHRSDEKRLFMQHEGEERSLISESTAKKPRAHSITWGILLLILLITFASRIINIGAAPKFFEFDPYFDMVSTQYILTYGYQLLHDHSAWPVLLNGTIHRIQPIVPYLEAYWYQLANTSHGNINTGLLSTVSSIYPPITAVLLVFSIFMLIYHEYGDFPALVAGALAAAMPALISAFIAGEQLLEPWGIFTLFFFFAAYLLAVKNPGEKRYAILAGIAFASTFLGAHYYTVDAGILAAYIVLQGIIYTLRRKPTKDFYVMNAIVIAVIVLFYALYDPYGASLTKRIPLLLHIPTIVAFPLFALILAMAFEYLPQLAKRYNVIKSIERFTYAEFMAAIIILIFIFAFLTPLGDPLRAYLSLSEKFTTPSTPLFMTVQEFAPTGPNYNFGSAGFGIIGASIGGASVLIWSVLLVFALLVLLNIIYKSSATSILYASVVVVLAVAGMSEVKYLPHFGAAYIMVIGVIIGELYAIIKKRHGSRNTYMYVLYAVILIAVLLESSSIASVLVASGQNCRSILNSSNVLGYNLFCNVVPNAWLSATAWMRQDIGPYGPRILAWWDYGDWINWFGNSNAVIRGDNAVAKLDYAVASHYVFGEGNNYSTSGLSGFMDSVQARYVLFDDQLIPKWSALDFLACIDVNATTQSFASAAGRHYGSPYLLGTSQCEMSNDPVMINFPTNPTINEVCSFSNSSVTAVKGILTVGETIPEVLNQSYCVSLSTDKRGLLSVYNLNGTKANIVINPTFYYGSSKAQNGELFAEFMAIYLPDSSNYTVSDAPTSFYNSNFYRGFFFGRLPGYRLAYPSNFTGINYVNSTHTVMILELQNYTGSLPYVTPKPSWIENNYTMPG